MELVVLLDDAGEPTGTAPKATVHTASTLLHLAFSCYLFNEHDELLVTRRALTKLTWPGVWTNSFCGHPAPEEAAVDAVLRRARQELGAEVTSITAELPTFRYRAVDPSGIVENEVCPVFSARLVGDIDPQADEIADWAWVHPQQLRSAVTATPFAFSPWLVEQLGQLSAQSATYESPLRALRSESPT